ncbi:hypothetical protein ES703_66227 [subsurface metagenome]
MQCLKDGNAVPELGQISRGGQAGWSRANYRHPLAGWFHRVCFGFLLAHISPFPVSHVALQATDSTRGAFFSQSADFFTLRLLRADPPADAGQGILVLEYPHRLRHITFINRLDETGNVYPYRAAINAGVLGTLDAAACLFFSLF